MKKFNGFSLIEVIIFIVITSILSIVIIMPVVITLQKSPLNRQQMIALQTAQQCMEWYLGQRRMNGFSGITCSASPSTPTMCTLPSGYSFSNSITCTTINSDTNYKLITVSVTGIGDATLKSLIADY
jgi:type II secretory pathway pseudopilin PulG